MWRDMAEIYLSTGDSRAAVGARSGHRCARGSRVAKAGIYDEGYTDATDATDATDERATAPGARLDDVALIRALRMMVKDDVEAASTEERQQPPLSV